MSDELLTRDDREEELSRVYVDAVAAGAGYTTARQNFDRDGIDVQIRAGGQRRPTLDIQLKATVNLGTAVSGKYRYPLQRRNYDLLREEVGVPRILVVLDLPRDEADWLTVTAEGLMIRRCCFWGSLLGFPETSNTDSVTVSISENNLFDVATLKQLMNQARTGGIS